MGAPQDSNFGTATPVAAFFKTIGGAAFNFMVPILAGFIGRSIADRPGFLVGLVGGYLATTGATFAAVGGDIPQASSALSLRDLWAVISCSALKSCATKCPRLSKA